MSKVLCVLYADPVNGYPTNYPREEIPRLDRYPGGQTLPSPRGIDFSRGALLGSVSGALGLREFLEDNGHTLVVTAGRDEYLIVEGGKLAGTGARSYTVSRTPMAAAGRR